MNNPMLYLDGYKLDHRRQYPAETTKVYSNWTPRKSRIEGIDKVVFFGLQGFITKYLIEDFDMNFFGQNIGMVCRAYQRRINNYLGPNPIGTEHIRALHKLGYLPLKIKAVAEGMRTPIGVPQFTITNTHKDFYWLVNYFETLMSCELWGPSTSATIAYQYRKILDKWCTKTGGDPNFVQFQGHDFSMRGMYGVEAAKLSGAGHLLSFVGTDTVPAIDYLEQYYDADSDKELIGCSVAATEHAVMCVGTGFLIKRDGLTWERYGEAEYEVFRRLITEVYPTGIVSVVSDTWNLWTVLTDYLPKLKDTILARDGKLVIRPDSGDPADIICGNPLVLDFVHKDGGGETYKRNPNETELKGVVEVLWDTFGGTTTTGSDGRDYKVLDSHIGVIYGDSITLQRAEDICSRLASKGFASTNWVAGIGSYTYQYNTRDTFGFAMKATYAEIRTKICECCKAGAQTCSNDCAHVVGIEVFKDPITDDGTKKSKKGLMMVGLDTADGQNRIYVKDQQDWSREAQGILQTVFYDGVPYNRQSLKEIRERLKQ